MINDFFNMNSFTNWPLWIAQYGAREPAKTAWPTWVCWQYSNTGEIDGISGKVDLNDMKEDFFAALRACGTMEAGDYGKSFGYRIHYRKT